MGATITFLSTGKDIHGKCFNLMLDGTKIGYATAKVETSRSGPRKLRGTVYSAYLISGNRWFYGSRTTITREMLRAVGCPTE